LYTSSDVIEHLLDSVGGGSQDHYHRVLRQAVFHAYRDLITARDWRWHETSEVVDLVNNVVITGTVSTTSDLALITGQQVGDVYLVNSNNHRYQWDGTVWNDIGPQGYFEWTLPWGVQSVDSITVNDPVGWDYVSSYLEPRDFARLYNNTTYAGSTPAMWTVDKSPTAHDRYRLRVLAGWAAPTTGTITYRRRPKDIRYTGYEPGSRVGTAGWPANTLTVIGSGTSFQPLMEGAIIRVNGDTSFHPEGLTGMHPYTDEAVILEVVDATTLTVASPTGKNAGYVGSKYMITDALDLAPSMYTAMLSGAEMWTMRLLGKGMEQAFAMYNRDLRMAFESDAVAVISGGPRKHGWGPYGVYGHGDGGSLWWLYIRPGADDGLYGPGRGGPNADGTCDLACDETGGAADTVFDACGNEVTP
jgi:hypothetical protein